MRDECFIRDKVPMTKEEVRGISLSKLDLGRAHNLLDVGAGTGSVGIQAAVEYPSLSVTGIEQKELAVELIQKNCEKFGLTNYQLLSGKAPIPLTDSYDCIFIGGSGGNLTEIIAWSYELLNAQGRLVLNFILLENALEALAAIESLPFVEVSTVQVQVGDLTRLGKGHYFKQQNPTIVISCVKE